MEEFILVWLLGRYGAPLTPADTTSARVAPTAESTSHAARDSVGARVVWGNNLRAYLGIWREMLLDQTDVEGLALLSKFFLAGMSGCLSEFHRNKDLLHISLPIFNCVTRGAFTDHGNPLACLPGGISGWTSL